MDRLSTDPGVGDPILADPRLVHLLSPDPGVEDPFSSRSKFGNTLSADPRLSTRFQLILGWCISLQPSSGDGHLFYPIQWWGRPFSIFVVVSVSIVSVSQTFSPIL